MLGQNIVLLNQNQLNLPTQQSDEYIANQNSKRTNTTKKRIIKKYLGYSYTITNLEKKDLF